ncbi:hypothetical protein CTJ10_12530, partial [Staphylococcus epidermidis]
DRRNDIDVFAAQHLVRLLADEKDRLTRDQDRLRAHRNRLSQDIADARGDLAQLKEQRKSAGGGEIDDWKKQIAGLEVERDRRRERATEFSGQLALADLRTPSNEETFTQTQREVAKVRGALEEDEKNEAQTQWEAEAKVREHAHALETTRQELASLTTRAS